MHIRRFLICTVLVAVAAYEQIATFVASIVDWPLRWHEYVPDPNGRMHLDRMALVAAAEPQGLRRYHSWRQRLSLHSLFTGDGFHEPKAVGTA